MKSFLLTIIIFTISFIGSSQELTYKHGRIYNSTMEKLNPTQVRALFANNPEALQFYNKGRTKGSVGGFLTGFGIGLIVGDLAAALYGTSEYPSPLTIAGATSILIGIPVSIGTNKNIRKSVESYNTKKIGLNIEKSSVIFNQNGVGMRANF